MRTEEEVRARVAGNRGAMEIIRAMKLDEAAEAVYEIALRSKIQEDEWFLNDKGGE